MADWGQFGNEVKNDFIRTFLILAIILGGVFLTRIWAASSFLFWTMIIASGLIWLLYKAAMSGYLRI